MTMRIRQQGPLARRLSDLRERAYVTRREVAHVAGVSEDNLASLEQGRLWNPTLRTLFKLAQAYGIDVTDLIDGIDETWWSGNQSM